jgi:DNA-binding transcriptional LysR family regulator
MDLNISTLRVFCKVVEVKSFSGASRELGITQPTVSQQIARIEEFLNAKAFERVGRNIFLTTSGQAFYHFAKELVEKADDFTAEMDDQKKSPSGLVRYGLQQSCQWTDYYRQAMSRLRNYPEIRFQIDVLPNDLILKKIKEGELDFGFVVGNHLYPELRFEFFADEHYSLVAADVKLFKPLKEKKFKEVRLITYPGYEPFFLAWFKSYGHEARAKKEIKSVLHIGSLSGAIHAVSEGAGVTILPTHCISDLISQNALNVYEKNKTKNATQKLHLVSRLGERHPKRTELILNMFREFKNNNSSY